MHSIFVGHWVECLNLAKFLLDDRLSRVRVILVAALNELVEVLPFITPLFSILLSLGFLVKTVSLFPLKLFWQLSALQRCIVSLPILGNYWSTIWSLVAAQRVRMLQLWESPRIAHPGRCDFVRFAKTDVRVVELHSWWQIQT